MQTGINVGTVVDKESISALTDSLVRIMETKADQETIREAFGVIERVAKVEGFTLKDVTVIGDRKTEVTIEADGEVKTFRSSNVGDLT